MNELWPADFYVDSIADIRQAYSSGYRGVLDDPESREKLLATSKYATFGDAAGAGSGLAESGKGLLSIPFLTAQWLNPEEFPGPSQGTGCCVSRAVINAASVSYAWEVWDALPDERRSELSSAVHANTISAASAIWSVREKAAESGVVFERWPDTASPSQQTFDHTTIYGQRGHRGQGSSCGRLATAIRDEVGLIPRGKHDIPGYGVYDCTQYSDRAAARSGPRWPQAFREYANKHRIRDVTQVTTIEQARDALANSFGICVGSNFACASTRPSITDSNGNVCAGPNRWRGRWSHAMAWTACDDRPWTQREYGGPLFLIQNSWGEWNDGPRRIWGTDLYIPVGSMWITAKTAASLLREDDAYALSNARGFIRQPLHVSWW